MEISFSASAAAAHREMTSDDVARRIGDDVRALTRRYALPAEAATQLSTLLGHLASDPRAPTSLRAPGAILRDHLADSLAALELPQIRAASTIADIGSGAGLPGLPLAIALPRARLSLIESRRQKARFIKRAASACRTANVEIVHGRVEECPELAERFDAVVARALAPLAVVAEYAAPLMKLGGTLVVWRGSHDAAAEAAAARAGEVVGLDHAGSLTVTPYAEVRDRHLYLMVKVRITPDRFPRRPGLARRRPLAASPKPH